MPFGFSKLFLVAPLIAASLAARAQDNYEIQIYGSETIAPKTTMIELHSNFTVDGSKPAPNAIFTAEGFFPTNHAEHETVEITQGINAWSEVGFYIFTSYRDGQGFQWVGDHIRPRVRAPASWHLPVGLSISNEIGYQRARFSPDSWTWEIRPIIDKQAGRYYLAFNPVLDRAWHGPGIRDGVVFAPNVKVGYDFTKKVQAGVEYYGATGPVFSASSFHGQQHQFFFATDLNVSADWELNFGIGVGVTASTDHLIVKGILGRRFTWGHRPSELADGVK